MSLLLIVEVEDETQTTAPEVAPEVEVVNSSKLLPLMSKKS
jgi:hypothetical protein